jgi:hypothetical protein
MDAADPPGPSGTQKIAGSNSASSGRPSRALARGSRSSRWGCATAPDALHRRKPVQIEVAQKQLNTTENRGVPARVRVSPSALQRRSRRYAPSGSAASASRNVPRALAEPARPAPERTRPARPSAPGSHARTCSASSPASGPSARPARGSRAARFARRRAGSSSSSPSLRVDADAAAPSPQALLPRRLEPATPLGAVTVPDAGDRAASYDWVDRSSDSATRRLQRVALSDAVSGRRSRMATSARTGCA